LKRYGRVIRLRRDKVEEYRRLHAAVPREVLATIRACSLRNYTIFIRELDDGRPYLFASFEHHGDDYAADMRRMAADPATQAWWRLTDPCQEPIEPGAWWAEMEEIFHHP
jgi:L-rhamnose mutarotase